MTGSVWTWLIGYLVVRFKGLEVERALNAAAQAGIPLWAVERLTTDIVIARLAVRDFRKLRPILRRYRVRAAIFEREGFPFVLSGLSRRMFFIGGLILACLIILYLSSFVWFIEVTGNAEIPAEDILNAAVSFGLVSGLPKRALNPSDLEAALLGRFPDLAWARVRVTGTKVVIEVVERQREEYDPNRHGDIVARYGGVVTDVFVARGTPQVRAGDEVQPGDVLISGTYYDRGGRRQEGRAQGAVWAQVWRESFAEASLHESYQVDTGRTRKQLRIRLGKYLVPLGPSKPFQAYRTQDRLWQLKLGKISLPVQFVQRTFFEVEHETRFLHRSAAAERALEEAWRKLEADGVDRSKTSQVQVATVDVPDAEAVRVILRVYLEQNIGEFQEH
jgi:similar to stage IV sporulation protein